MKILAWILRVFAFLVAVEIVYLGGVARALFSRSWVWSEHGWVAGAALAVLVAGDYGYTALASRDKRKGEPIKTQEVTND